MIPKQKPSHTHARTLHVRFFVLFFTEQVKWRTHRVLLASCLGHCLYIWNDIIKYSSANQINIWAIFNFNNSAKWSTVITLHLPKSPYVFTFTRECGFYTSAMHLHVHTMVKRVALMHSFRNSERFLDQRGFTIIATSNYSCSNDNRLGLYFVMLCIFLRLRAGCATIHAKTVIRNLSKK